MIDPVICFFKVNKGANCGATFKETSLYNFSKRSGLGDGFFTWVEAGLFSAKESFL